MSEQGQHGFTLPLPPPEREHCYQHQRGNTSPCVSNAFIGLSGFESADHRADEVFPMEPATHDDTRYVYPNQR